MSEVPDLRPGYYYVSCTRDDGAWRPVRGPWTSHADALAAVPLVKAEAEAIDPRAIWYAWGTLRASDDLGPGVLGPALEMTPSAGVGPGARQARCGAECRACRRPDIEPEDLEWDARAGTGGAELLRVLGFDGPRDGDRRFVVAIYTPADTPPAGRRLAVRVWEASELVCERFLPMPSAESLATDASVIQILRSLTADRAAAGAVRGPWSAGLLLAAVEAWARHRATDADDAQC
jgi:hypothetical protein